MKKRSLKLFWIPGTVYLIGVIFLFPVFRYYDVDNADTFSYLTIAEKYATGNFHDAINGTWSPVISWLLALLSFTKIDLFFLFKAIEIPAGLFGIYLTSLLIDKFKIRRSLGLLLQLSFVPCFWSFALLWATPDLLFLDTLLILHLIFIDFDGINQRTAFWIGITGALLYVTKAYGVFYFPALCVFGYALIYYRSNDKILRQRILVNTLKSISVFIFLSSFWIAAISLKYDRFVISDAATYNENISPSMNEKVVHPVISNGLTDPRVHHSLFAWEDPVLYNSEYGIQKTPFDIHKRTDAFMRNVSSFYYYQYRNQIGWLFIISLLCAIIFLRERWKERPFPLIIFTVLFFPTAYFLILIVDRYLWIITILMGISIIYISHHLILQRKQWIAWPLAILCCLLLIKRPLKEILWRTDTSKTFSELAFGLTHFKTTLSETYKQDAVVFTIADSLKKRTDLKGTVAGFNNHSHYTRESYPLTLTICYYLDNPFFGQLNRSLIEKEKLQQLFERKIDFYYVWMHDSLNNELVKPFPLVYENREAGLRIFKIAPGN